VGIISPGYLLIASLDIFALPLWPIVWSGRPIHRCFAQFQGQLNVKTSIIEAFATFLLLSYLEILWVSSDLLVPTQVYGKHLGLYLFYDGGIHLFGKEHFPYAILALIVSLLFNVFPLLLLAVSLQCFQRCLGNCRGSWPGLHIFVDAFQGCYKNGTVAGTRDCRYFAAVHLIVRIMMLAVYAITLTALFFGVGLLILIALALSVAIIQPYRQDLAIYNTVDIVLILMMAAWYGSLLCAITADQTAHIHLKVFLVVSFIIAILPLVYLSYIVLRWLVTRRSVQQKLCQRFRTWKQSNRTQLLSDSDLPDRIVNPDNYNRDLIDPTTEDNANETSNVVWYI